MTIAINLDDLTQEHIDRCVPLLGTCSYSGPCIIGTLISAPLGANDHIAIESLIEDGIISVPAHQRDEAQTLQTAFDMGNEDTLAEMLLPRGLRWPA